MVRRLSADVAFVEAEAEAGALASLVRLLLAVSLQGWIPPAAVGEEAAPRGQQAWTCGTPVSQAPLLRSAVCRGLEAGLDAGGVAGGSWRRRT